MTKDRMLTFHVHPSDGRIVATVYALDIPISRHVYNRFPQPAYELGRAGLWKYPLQLLARCDKEWAGLTWGVTVTFEVE
jgi:hypothetical protein